MAVALGDLARKHGAGRAVDVLDRKLVLHRLLRFERRLAQLDQLVVEHACSSPWSCFSQLKIATPSAACAACGRAWRSRARVPSSARWRDPCRALRVCPIISVKVRKPSCGHDLAHFLGDEEEVVDHVLGLALELGAQHRILRGDADGAGVQMALAHHDAAGRDQRRGGKAEFVGAEQCADDHVAPGAHAAVDLHRDAAAQAVGERASDASRRGRSPTASPRA